MKKSTAQCASYREITGSGGRNRDGGFTLLETLLTVAVLVILLGLSLAGAARYKDHLKITELDNAARDIYMAAENRAVLLQNNGRVGDPSSTLLSPGAEIGDLVSLGELTLDDGTVKKACMLSETTKSATLDELLPVGTIDPALRDEHFRVVYDESTGHVVEVFYAEGDIDNNLTLFRGKSRSDRVAYFRENRDARQLVGYYGGSIADNIGTHPLPTPGVEVFIENGNELTLTVTYTIPTVDGSGTPVEANRAPNVTLEYGGTKVTLLETTNSTVVSHYDSRLIKSGDITDSGVSVAKYTWVLDSLESGKQFKGLTGGSVELGDDFTVKASLTLTADGYIESTYYAEGRDNSLFAKGSNYGVDPKTALIVNLRHLQNLHPGHSNVGGGIVNAEQLVDIDCKKARRNNGPDITPEDESYNFIPIKNTNLASYNGGQKNITDLYVNTSGDAGLFGEVKASDGSGGVVPSTVKGVRLINAEVHSTNSGSAGALAGSAANTSFTDIRVENAAVGGGCAGGMVGKAADSTFATDIRVINSAAIASGDYAGGLVGSLGGGTLSDCQVYWSEPESLVKNGDFVYVVKGTNAGGLAGRASGTVTVTKSFAAATIEGKNAGGLIGSGSASLEKSYADCYLKGSEKAGGLIGSGSASSSLESCYASGFIVDSGESAQTAGLANGSVTGTDAYSVVRVIGDDKLKIPGKPLYDSLGDGVKDDANKVFYLFMPEDDATQAAKAVLCGASGAFGDKSASDTHIYDLRFKLGGISDKLTPPYPYPGLKDLPHYCDWAGLEEETEALPPAGLAYYETYSQEYDGQKGYGSIQYGVWGSCEGTTIDTGLPDDSLIKYDSNTKKFSDLQILRDGYALVFEDGCRLDVSVGYQVSYGSQIWTLSKEGADTSETDTAVENVDEWIWTKDGVTEKVTRIPLTQGAGEDAKSYSLIPLPDAVVTGPPADSENFYQNLTAVWSYYFNPHFAKTVTAGTVTKTPATGTEPEKIEYTKPERPSAPSGEGNSVRIRTPRHLYDLSAYQDSYSPKDFYFKQELDLDYNTYTGYESIFAPSGQTMPFRQKPIGVNADVMFAGTYDGASHSIQNVFYDSGSAENYLGLFGCAFAEGAAGTLKNINYLADWAAGQTVSTSGNDTYVGTLAGYAGNMENCKVAAASLTIQGNGAFTYGGGLAGRADRMDACRVEAGSLSVAGTGTTYAGGLVGYAEQINNTCETTVNGNLTVSGTDVFGGGLTGQVNGPMVGAAATVTGDLTVMGTHQDTYGGGLVGYADSSMINCTATVGGDMTVTERGDNPLNTYGGGLAGRVKDSTSDTDKKEGEKFDDNQNILVSGCSATIRSLNVTGAGLYTYGGGLVGYAGSITDGTAKVTGTGKILTVKGEGAAANAYGGGLAGGSRGSVLNCAIHAADAELTVIGEGIKPTTETENGNETYGGGLVGRANGAVSEGSVQITSLEVTGRGVQAYGGGMAGYANNILNCKNVNLKKLTLTGEGAATNVCGGGLAGMPYWGASACSIDLGNLEVCVEGTGDDVYGGGLVGRTYGTISDCTATTKSLAVKGTTVATSTCGGGLAGYAAIITNCNNVTIADLTVETDGAKSGAFGGGLVGYVTNTEWSLQNSTATVTGTLTVRRTGGPSGAEDPSAIENAFGGGLVGRTFGTVSGCAAKVTSLNVSGDGTNTFGAGLAGSASGLVSGCEAEVTDQLIVEGNDLTYAAGLVGLLGSTIDNSTAMTKEITVRGNGLNGSTYVGGLVGLLGSTIDSSTAMTREITVRGNGSTYVGGLVAHTIYNMTNCAAGVYSMDVTGTGSETAAGGLVGFANTNTIDRCSAGISLLKVSAPIPPAPAQSSSFAGGLAGYMLSGTIKLSYAAGRIDPTTIATHAGGLTGYTDGTIENCYAAVQVPASGSGIQVSRGLAGGWDLNTVTITDSYWLRGTFRYCGSHYTMDGSGLLDSGLGIAASEVNDKVPAWLKDPVNGGMYPVSTPYTFTGELPSGESWTSDYMGKHYPYPTGVTNKKWGWAAGHYGLWPILEHD